MIDRICSTELQLNELILLMPECRLFIFIFLYPMTPSPLRCVINGAISILVLLISGSLMAISLGEPLMECLYPNIIVSLEYLLTLVTTVTALTAKLLKQGYRYHSFILYAFLCIPFNSFCDIILLYKCLSRSGSERWVDELGF